MSGGSPEGGKPVFDGVMLDVGIGMLLIFLVSSLIASAVVETIGGFLHRRSKHLWDTLDLLLGNTSTDGEDSRSIVDELYRTPFITGLVRPTDRAHFDPAKGERHNGRVPIRAAPLEPVANKMVATRASSPEEKLRRYYGPIHINGRDFTNGLLSVLRPDGKLDQGLETLGAIRSKVANASSTDIALDDISGLLDTLKSATTAIGAGDVTAAIDALKAGGERIPTSEVQQVVANAESAIAGFSTGQPTKEQIVAALEVVPHDLRIKLLAVVDEAGDEIVKIRAGIEDWYERTMTAASSWYRKQTRWFLFAAGLVMAVSLNVDAIGAATTLYRDEPAREAIVALADEVVVIECSTTGSDGQPEETALDLDCVRGSVGGSLSLPIGWADVDTGPWAWVLRVVGWIVIAGSVTVGAPFWYDLLGRALRHRSSKPGAQ